MAGGSEQLMTKAVGPFSPIDRRQFVQGCAGSLALAAVSCGRRKDRASSRSSTVTVAAEKDPMNPDSPAQFLVFLPLVSYTEKGELEGRLARTWSASTPGVFTTGSSGRTRWATVRIGSSATCPRP